MGLTGVELLHVPYTGAQQYMTDLLAGRIDLAMTTPGSVAKYIEEVRPLALAQPFESLLAPGVPTSEDVGIPDLFMPSWIGISVPKGTPADIIAKIDAAMAEVHEWPEYQEQVLRLRTEPFYVSGQEYDAELEKLRGRVSAIVEQLDLGQGN